MDSAEEKFHAALKRISSYMPADKLRRQAEKLYGLEGDEAIEMAYENVIAEAKQALKGYRKPRTVKGPAA
jgi:hypothetical protein